MFYVKIMDTSDIYTISSILGYLLILLPFEGFFIENPSEDISLNLFFMILWSPIISYIMYSIFKEGLRDAMEKWDTFDLLVKLSFFIFQPMLAIFILYYLKIVGYMEYICSDSYGLCISTIVNIQVPTFLLLCIFFSLVQKFYELDNENKFYLCFFAVFTVLYYNLMMLSTNRFVHIGFVLCYPTYLFLATMLMIQIKS